MTSNLHIRINSPRTLQKTKEKITTVIIHKAVQEVTLVYPIFMTDMMTERGYQLAVSPEVMLQGRTIAAVMVGRRIII